MTKHYGYDELLAHAYLPEENAELELHIASCERCEERFRALRAELARHAQGAAQMEKHETFWKRQELGVMRAIDRRQRRIPGIGAQLAAAAVVVFVVGAFWIGRGSVTNAPSTITGTAPIVATASPIAVQDNGLASTQLTTDPWQSEQLEDFQSVVDWETWDDDDQKNRGTI